MPEYHDKTTNLIYFSLSWIYFDSKTSARCYTRNEISKLQADPAMHESQHVHITPSLYNDARKKFKAHASK